MSSVNTASSHTKSKKTVKFQFFLIVPIFFYKLGLSTAHRSVAIWRLNLDFFYKTNTYSCYKFTTNDDAEHCCLLCAKTSRWWWRRWCCYFLSVNRNWLYFFCFDLPRVGVPFDDDRLLLILVLNDFERKIKQQFTSFVSQAITQTLLRRHLGMWFHMFIYIDNQRKKHKQAFTDVEFDVARGWRCWWKCIRSSCSTPEAIACDLPNRWSIDRCLIMNSK